MSEFSHELTWYKKTGNAQVFERRVLSHVFWMSSKAANVRKSGLLDSDKATVYIPFLDANGKSRGDIEIGIGDWLVPGVASEEMQGASFMPTDLLKKYPRAIRVRSVDLKDYGPDFMEHWEVSGN